MPGSSIKRHHYGGYSEFSIRDEVTDGGPTHVFGRVIVRTRPGPRPVPLWPEDLSPVGSEPRGTVELRWHGIEGAAGYLVQVAPLEMREPAVHGFSLADRQRCLGGQAWSGAGSIQAITAVPTCRLDDLQSVPAGLYRWRVWGLDPLGVPLGEPSDWAFLLAD